MICRWCADAADHPYLDRCSVCYRGPVFVYNDAQPREEQKVYIHKNRGERCEGSLQPPVTGHAMCSGCDCQHEPPGSHTDAQAG